MNETEDSFLDRLKKGERKAMEELYDRWSPVLFGVALRYCSRREEAEDVLQEALIRIVTHAKDFKPAFKGAFEAWMKRITVNQCLTSLRKKMNFVPTENAYDVEAEVDDEAQEDDYPDLKPDEIIRLMQQLPPGYRTVLNMYVFEGLSHNEIAAELKISVSTSKSQLMKARQTMKKLLMKYKRGEEVLR